MRGSTFTIAGLCLGIAFASPAVAGTIVEGVGSSRSVAMNDANERAARLAQQRWGRMSNWRNCIGQARVDQCRQDRGEWICRASVADHAGSC